MLIREFSNSRMDGLPHGIIQARSDLELKPLWPRSEGKIEDSSYHNLLAIASGIKQKKNIKSIFQKFLAEKFTVLIYHDDGKLDGWWDLDWGVTKLFR